MSRTMRQFCTIYTFWYINPVQKIRNIKKSSIETPIICISNMGNLNNHKIFQIMWLKCILFHILDYWHLERKIFRIVDRTIFLKFWSDRQNPGNVVLISSMCAKFLLTDKESANKCFINVWCARVMPAWCFNLDTSFH